MRRCGFDSFAPNQAIDRAAADKALATWPEVYQKTVDGRAAIWPSGTGWPDMAETAARKQDSGRRAGASI
jgi:hypothetical protein